MGMTLQTVARIGDLKSSLKKDPGMMHGCSTFPPNLALLAGPLQLYVYVNTRSKVRLVD